MLPMTSPWPGPDIFIGNATLGKCPRLRLVVAYLFAGGADRMASTLKGSP